MCPSLMLTLLLNTASYPCFDVHEASPLSVIDFYSDVSNLCSDVSKYAPIFPIYTLIFPDWRASSLIAEYLQHIEASCPGA